MSRCYSHSAADRRAKYRDDRACLSVCFVCVRLFVSISPELHARTSEGLVHVTHGRVSVLLWRRCDMLRTSGFVDDVTIAQ